MKDLSELIPFLEDSVWIAALIFMRVTAAMALLPGFGEQVTPMRVKLVAAISFAAIITPAVWSQMAEAYAKVGWFPLLGTEMLAGLLIGVLFRLFVIVLQIAGTVASCRRFLAEVLALNLNQP